MWRSREVATGSRQGKGERKWKSEKRKLYVSATYQTRRRGKRGKENELTDC